MKKGILFFFSWLCLCLSGYSQAVAINDDASLPHPSAILDVKVAASAKKGVLFPRMTSAQRSAIVSPAKGLLVYDSTSNAFWYHNGTAWQQISSGGPNFWTANGTHIYNNNTGFVGIGLSSPKAKLNVAKSQNVLFGESLSGLGLKTFWLASKAAFRTGEVADAFGFGAPYPWDNTRIGYGSFAAGSDAVASGMYSISLGWLTQASGKASFSAGAINSASGDYAAVFGEYSDASGRVSFSANGGSASGDMSASFNSSRSLAEGGFSTGYSTDNYGEHSAVFGYYSINRSNHSTVIGENNDPIVVEGSTLPADQQPLFIIGNGTNFDARRNALVTLRNGITAINRNPGAAVNDGMLQIKQGGTRHLLTLEAGGTTNKWSFNLTPNLVLYYNNALRGTFSSSSGAYVSVSDERLKKDIQLLEPVLEDVRQLKTYTYHMAGAPEESPVSYGLMAQEVQQVFPAMVEPIEQNGEKYMGLNYANFSVVAIKAIQEQQALIDRQAEEIRQHADRIQKLENEMAELKKMVLKLK